MPFRRPVSVGTAAVSCLTFLSLAGCSSEGCTDVGGLSGVSATTPAALDRATGSIRFEVCDAAGCAESTREWVDRRGQPSGRLYDATWEQLGREFDPGLVSLTVELRDAGGRIVAARTQDVLLETSFPNGARCDGDGYVHASVELSEADLV